MENSRGRKTAIAVLLILACVLAPLAATAVWTRNQVSDTDRYIRTVKPLASDEDIQDAVATQVTTSLFSRVDVEAEAEAALPPRAKFLAGPLAGGVQSYTEQAALRVVQSDQFEQLWIRINRLAHRQLNKVLTDEGSDVVSTADGKVVLDLTPVFEEVKRELVDRGVTVFQNVPASAVTTRLVLMDSDELQSAQQGFRLLKAVSYVLPILVFGMIGVAIAISRRRRRTLLQASLGFAASMVVLGIGILLARSVYVDYVAGAGLPTDAAQSFFDIMVHWLRIGIRALFAIALLVAAGAFFTGPSRLAVATRERFGRGVSSAAAGTGVRATPAGRWVGANKRALRIAAIVIPVLVLFLWSTPTVALLVTLVALALLALLAIELVAAPAEEPPPAPLRAG